MSVNSSQLTGFATELSATMTGSWVSLGSLTQNPTIMIFDNQGTVDIAISVDGGTTTWKTFSGGEALVLDLRASSGIAANQAPRLGTTFHGNGASGTFRISYIYAVT